MSGRSIDRQRRYALARTICRLTDTFGGRLPSFVARELAESFGVSESTVWRIRAEVAKKRPDGRPHRRKKPKMTVGQKKAIGGAHGKVKVAWRRLDEAGKVDVGYRQFLRWVHDLHAVEKISLTEGAHVGAAKSLALKQIVDNKNDVWHFDHTPADIYLTFRGYVGKPHISTIMDAKTRLILAMVVIFGKGIGGDPNAASIVELLVQAMLGWEDDGTEFGGVPAVVVYDNALAHTAKEVQNGLMSFGIYARAIQRATPRQQGKVEALVDTITSEFIAKLPGYTHGLTTQFGKVPSADAPPMGYDAFVDRANEWIREYNAERAHTGIGGRTPYEVWRSDPTAVQRPAPEQVREAFIGPAEKRVVFGFGVKNRNTGFTCDALGGMVGRTVLLRALPSSNEFVYVYDLDDQFIGIAKPHEDLSTEERRAIAKDGRNAAARASRWIKEGVRERAQKETQEAARRQIVDATDATPSSATGHDAEVSAEEAYAARLDRLRPKHDEPDDVSDDDVSDDGRVVDLDEIRAKRSKDEKKGTT